MIWPCKQKHMPYQRKLNSTVMRKQSTMEIAHIKRQQCLPTQKQMASVFHDYGSMYATTPGQDEARYILDNGIYILLSVSTSLFDWEESDVPVPGHLPLCHSLWGSDFNHGLTSEHSFKKCILRQVKYKMWCCRCYRYQLRRPFNVTWVGHTGRSSGI